MIVWIRSLDKPSAQKRHEYTTHNGRRMNKTKAGTAATTFKIMPDFKKGMLRTGFDAMVPNPFYAKSAEDARLPSEWHGSEVWKHPTVSKQTKLEIKHNVKPGTYTSVLPNMLNRGKNPKYTYLQSFKFELNDGSTPVDTSIPRHEIMHEVAKESYLIANSKDEAAFSKKAEFYISNINEDEEDKATRNKLKRQAVANLYEMLNKQSKTRILDFSRAIGIIKTDHVSQEKIENALDDFINTAGAKQNDNINKFIAYYDMLKKKEGVEKIKAEALLLRLAEYRIIDDKQSTYKWHSKAGTSLHVFANTKDEAISFLLNPNKTEYRAELEHELKAKKNI